MNDYLPALGEERRLTSSMAHQAVRAQRRAEMDVYRHHLQAAVDVEKDIIDAQALGTVVRYAAADEMAFIDEGLARAQGHPARVAVVAEKADLLRRTNSKRISKRFGA